MRIQTKVFLTLVFSSAFIVLAMMQSLQWSMDEGLIDYVNQKQLADYQEVITELTRHYQNDGSWQHIENNPRVFGDLIRDHIDHKSNETTAAREGARPPARPPPGARPPRERRPPPKGGPNRRGAQRPVLLDKLNNIVVGPRHLDPGFLSRMQKITISADGITIGYIGLPEADNLPDAFELQFVDRLREVALLTSVIVILFAGITAFVFSRTIVKPIKQLAANTSQLIKGKYQLETMPLGKDELGDLSRDINELAKTLDRNTTLRQQWFANTSHELRTPLAIIKGEVEAMIDGVRALDLKHLDSLVQEVNQLQRLIDDLADLSNADLGSLRYQKHHLDLKDILETKQEQYQTATKSKGLEFELSLPANEVCIYADETRINQMFDNFLANSCKYTDSPGKLIVKLDTEGDAARITFEDSFPSVPEASLAQLFDYLYRVDDSRNRQTGGSGLGLAIAKKIADAHDGSVTAAASHLGGLSIQVLIPRVITND